MKKASFNPLIRKIAILVISIAFLNRYVYGLSLTDNTEQYFSQNNAEIKVETSELSYCYYSTEEDYLKMYYWGNGTTSFSKTLTLGERGYTYYVLCYKSSDYTVNSTIVISFVVDLSEPHMLVVNDTNRLLKEYPDYSYDTTKLFVSFIAEENLSGIKRYHWQLFDDMHNLISDGERESNRGWITGLSLENRKTYFFIAYAENNAGLLSDPLSSDGITVELTLKPYHCENGVLDDSETSIDCGGICDKCDTGKKCLTNTDCISRYCNMGNYCWNPTCYDHVQNQDEEGIDCGGPCPDCPSCYDGKQNQLEEDIDCGGPCKPCASCSDGIQNQGEDYVDCGGPCPDCESCSDGIQNQEEENIDCGGPCVPCEKPAPFKLDFIWIITTIIIVVVVGGASFGVKVSSHHKKKKTKAKSDESFTKLVNYAQQAVNQGHTIQQIRQAILQKGWQEPIINQVLTRVTMPKVLYRPRGRIRKKRKPLPGRWD